MTKDEALKLALEALMFAYYEDKDYNDDCQQKVNEARQAIREALAQPEQEQVAYTGNGTAGREADVKPTGFFFQMPPQRTWVGLTDDDLRQIILVAIGVAEAKLKEKNT